MKTTLFNSKNIKIIVVILIIGIIFIYFICKKKRRVERFDNVDKNILCVKYNDIEEIKKFRTDMGYEKLIDKIKSNIGMLDEGIPIGEGKNITINYRYDFIQLEKNILEKRKEDFVLSPTGIIFDPKNDDIIVFDIYKLRRFQYRLNRSKFDMSKEDINKLFDIRNNKNESLVISNSNYNPRNIEILSEFEKKRKLIYIQVLIYLNEISNDGLKNQLLLLIDYENIIQDNYIENNTDFKFLEVLEKINLPKLMNENQNFDEKIGTKIDRNLVNNNIFINNVKILTGYDEGSVPMNQGELLNEITKNLDFFKKYLNLKECRNNAILPNSNPKRYSCSIKYQEDLPKYDLGQQGKGIESLNYDKKFKAPLFNNKMNPLSNSWREPKYNGVFEPIKSYRDKRVYNQYGKKGTQIKDANTLEDKYIDNIGFKGVTLKAGKDKNSNNKNYLVNNEEIGKTSYKGKKNLLFEPFDNSSPKLVPGLPTIGIGLDNLSHGYFVLPDELDAVGVKMCIFNLDNNNFIFVPDVLNNRIQIFSIERGAEFDYKGQFGNLDYTSYRSLPTYQGKKVINIFEPLKNTSIMYEPIHNMELFEQDIMRGSPTRCVKTCNYQNGNYVGSKNINKFFNKKENTITSETQCYSELKNKLYSQGPEEIRFSDSSSYGLNFDEYYKGFLEFLEKQKKENEKKEGIKDILDNTYSLFEENVEECVTELSTRRANIHHRQYELNSNNELVPIKRGHFYSLYNEYVRVRSYLKRNDIKESVYGNPFNLVDGAELCMGKFKENCTKSKDPYDGVEGCSLAYRRFLIKIIKETNEGQKYGQLFRPKSITYDSESDLFYVVDTYHHCIQCFKLKKNTEEEKYKSGTELVFESADKDLNETAFYCYNKDWDYNLGYHSTPVYSLGLRQQILEIDEEQRRADLNKGADVFPSVDLEGSYPIPESNVEDDWVKKYAESDGKVRLYRWVSGSSKYGNYVYDNDKNIDYNKIGRIKNGIRNNEDYFFYTSLVKKDINEDEEDEQHEKEAINNPGVGEFLYPSDIVFVKRDISPVENNDLLLVADTGNNRVSIFKKYFLNIDTVDKYRFRFYRFLGDNDLPEDRKLVNPIGIALNPINGSILVLQGNMFDYKTGIYEGKQSIKVFIPKRIEEEGYYKYSHTISLEKFKNDLGTKDPRFTKIEVDNRGIILLTDINNNRIHILRETINNCNPPNCLLKLTKVNSNLLNKVIFEVKYNPHQGINKLFDPFMDKYLKSFNRFRLIIERFNISTGNKFADILLSKEYNQNYFDSIENMSRDVFVYEDKYESLPRKDGYWYVNSKEEQVLIDNSENINSSNFLDTKIIKKKNIYNNVLSEGIEDWQGKSMMPNTSYKYILHLFNYHSILNIKSDIKEVIEINTHPLNVPSKSISISNIVTKNENYLNIFVDYLSISKLHKDSATYNPLCLYILRRNHNRTRDGLLRYLNLFRHNIIQLFVPNASKYIYNNFSKPKFGKLYLYDITQSNSPLELTSSNLLLPSDTNKYQDSRYIIFYSAEGGMIEENGKILPTSDTLGMDYIEDFFTLGDDPRTPHTKIKYQVKIDIRQSHKRVIMISDNSTLESNLLYYKKNRFEKDENSLDLIKKFPIAQLESNKYKNKLVEYQDKGYIKDGIKVQLPLNKTLEYSIFVANQYKINPSCTTLYYTTRPEKPYIKKISKVEVNEGGKKVSKIKLEWYYTQNRNLYWPINFMVLRLPIEDEGPSVPVITHKLDFTQGSPHENDKYFNIEPSLVTVKGDGEYTFEKTFNLDGQRTWEVKFVKFNNKKEPGFKDIFINGKKFIWSPNNTSYVFTNSFITINMKLNAKEDEYLNQIIVTEFIVVESEGPSISENQLLLTDIINQEFEKAERNIRELKNDSMKLKQKYLDQLDTEYNDKFIQAVEAYRKRNQIGFYFNLQDDYNGYYRSVVDNYSGNSGQLLVYLQALTDNDLLEIFDELHDKIKIYHGDATMTVDGPNGMLRSGGRDAMIEKIRHLSFMIKEATKSENKSLGITCMEQDFNDIFNQSGFQGVSKCLSEEKAKKQEDLNQNTPIASPEKLSSSKLDELTSNFEIEMETDFISLDAKEVSGESLQSVLEKFNFGGDWEQNGINNIVYDLERNTAKLIKEKASFNTNNKLGNKDTILIWRKGEKNISEGPSVSTTVSRNIKPYQVLKQGQPIKQLGSFLSEEDKNEILLNYAIPPTPVSLSAEKDLPATVVFNNPKLDEGHLYSTHIQYLPADLDKQYSYKIGCFQNGHSLNSAEKKNYLGIVNNGVGSELGMGEVYSEEAVIGRKTNITKVENEISTVSDLVTPTEPPETIMPVIKYFEPKEGTEDTIIRIVGSKLEDLDYLAMRDVKLKVLKKQKRIIEENGEKVTYDEFLVKPPTLKELERECWQSYETYKTLVWGYYSGTGKQIVSSEVGPDNKMYKYLVRSICPDQQLRKYAPSV